MEITNSKVLKISLDELRDMIKDILEVKGILPNTDKYDITIETNVESIPSPGGDPHDCYYVDRIYGLTVKIDY